jgi:membrane-associated protease RseP (regulator of RpoE activity)
MGRSIIGGNPAAEKMRSTGRTQKFDNYTVFLSLRFPEGVLQVRVSPRHSGWQQDGSRLGATFMPIVNKKAGKQSVMLEGRLEPEKLAEYAFHVPADPSVLGGRCELNVHLQGHEPASVARLDVLGRVTPSFGVSLDADKGGVKIKAVIRGGASEKAGLKAGDVLVSIDGEKVSDVPNLIDRLGRNAVGEEAKLVVRRGGQEKAIVVRVE